MEQLPRKVLLWHLLLLQSCSVHLFSVLPPGSGASTVVSEATLNQTAGARALLRCQSPRMVWTQDRLRDRQRVVHWDLSGGPGGPARRLLDMYSAGEQRVYAARDRGRLLLAPTAFQEGNFSLIIRSVKEQDEGLYTCNLHHHYCHLYETLAIRLQVTDDPLAAGAHWDGEKEVLVVERGSPALLTCVNRAQVWTERHLEEEQQVVHWDRQPPGVPHDRADRLLDLYASGERRAYGPPFLRVRMEVSMDAFARGDFSLSIDPLELADEGTYSCHLHHHYCGLHERRIFHLAVSEPAPEPHGPPPVPEDTPSNRSSQSRSPSPADPPVVQGHNVINVIIPESRAHFFQQLGYVLVTPFLFILLLITVVLATRHWRRQRGYAYDVKTSGGKDVNMKEFSVDSADLSQLRNEDIRLDYKNNILKERVDLALGALAKNIDLDRGSRKNIVNEDFWHQPHPQKIPLPNPAPIAPVPITTSSHSSRTSIWSGPPLRQVPALFGV
uniref:Matrix remodeling-associated protein 8 n=1 Tax=Phascolarctos cinereus TaxID=38626 RepID=A0A6P5JCV1_PHACI|nr:matrix remodeling-associated protein 8 [Phascolarctos cinereus]XP_020832000.1 matrix remodeling-associated protein 8 [Phascolarctos cinereus]